MNHTKTVTIIRNSFFGILSAFIMVLLNFVVRIFLVRSLGEEYYGLHSLFQSITSVMALLEMGLSTAMIIHLYEPVKKNDYKTICSYLSFYKNVYLKLACAFFLLSLLICVLIPSFVTTSIEDRQVRIYFSIFAFSYVVDFATYHKRSLLFADQKNYVSILSTTICELLFRGTQIVLLLKWENYWLFLLLLIIEKITSNTICNIFVDRHYPLSEFENNLKLNSERKKSFFATLRPLFVNQVSATIQRASTSIIISILLGNVSIVGYYANYQLVISTFEMIFSQIGGAFTTTFGNISVDATKEDLYSAYRQTSFTMNLLCLLFFIGYMACIQDFVRLLFGADFLLSSMQVILIGIFMLITLYNIPIISVQNAMGLHSVDSKNMFMQALLSVVCGFCLGYLFGMEGILLGIIIPTLYFSTFIKGIKIYNIVFGINRRIYLKETIKFSVVALLYLIITIYVCEKVTSVNILLSLVYKCIIVLFIFGALTVILYRRNENLKYLFNVIKSYLQ